jgi:hypothetical protein
MTTKKRTTTGKSDVKKLKVKKETLKDLGARSKASDAKGGIGPNCYPSCVWPSNRQA